MRVKSPFRRGGLQIEAIDDLEFVAAFVEGAVLVLVRLWGSSRTIAQIENNVRGRQIRVSLGKLR